ncbi:MAG: DUF2911 domain-containing protein [Thermoanaerobaculia bacterium]
MHRRIPGALLALTLATLPAAAQRQAQNILLPDVSPRAEVRQAVGMAEIDVVYCRPAVNDREVWGALVPWGQVWRTGANENTVVTLSHDAVVQGSPLAAGSYGLHTIPTESGWTVIFSNDHNAWGSFAYDESHDALRVAASAREAGPQERLEFRFENLDEDSADLVLHWAGLEVPITFTFDADAITLASIRDQLTGLPQFFWMGYTQAANWALQKDLALEEALGWAETSIQNEERFENLQVKSQLLEKTGKSAEAAETMDRALAIANAAQLHNYGRTLLGQGDVDGAVAVFRRNVAQNPDAWFVEVGLARALSAQGDFAEAAEQMKVSLGKAPENQKAYIQGLVDQLEAGQDIN